MAVAVSQAARDPRVIVIPPEVICPDNFKQPRLARFV
jgi:hypothetical protein